MPTATPVSETRSGLPGAAAGCPVARPAARTADRPAARSVDRPAVSFGRTADSAEKTADHAATRPLGRPIARTVDSLGGEAGRLTDRISGRLAGRTAGTGITGRLAEAAGRPVSADSVAVFRIGFGLLVAYSSMRFLAKGWVDMLYLAPEHHLSYRWFEWVQPLPAPLMHLHVAALALLGLCIALGYRHRLATALFLVGFAYTELIDAALYLNHYWFITLAGVLLLILPVHHRWSLDAAAGRVVAHPSVAVGVVWALRAQLAVVYVFAGLAKLNPDWLFDAQPMRLWLADRTHVAVVGPLLDEPVVAYAASWAGACFDCTIVAWLLWRRSRPRAYAALVAFHLATGALFMIGVFPWVMIVSALIFFDPDWPRCFAASIRHGTWMHRPRRHAAGTSVPAPPSASNSRLTANSEPVPAGLSASDLLMESGSPSDADPRLAGGSRPVIRPWLVGLLAALAVVQLILPLRHYAIDGNVRWTGEGYYLSWRVMLTEQAGHVEYRVSDPAGGDSRVVGPELVLTDWQAAHAATRPDLIHATARLIAEHYADEGIAGVEVRADAWATMNGREAQRLIAPDVDLAAYDRGRAPPGWILPSP